MDWAATGKTFIFCYLSYGSRTANRTDSLYQTVNGLVGNVDWGESLTIVAYKFWGLNGSGARRRAANVWLAGEIHFLEITPPVIVLKVVYFLTQILKRIEKICFR